jgi:hypothetical protein
VILVGSPKVLNNKSCFVLNDETIMFPISTTATRQYMVSSMVAVQPPNPCFLLYIGTSFSSYDVVFND